MERLRETIERHSRWQPLEKYIRRIETYKSDDHDLVFENCKALLESISKEILIDIDGGVANNQDVHQLVRDVARKINSLSQIPKIISGLVTISLQFGELRNKIGTTSHGRSLNELEVESLGETLLDFLINTTENVACFIIGFYEVEYPQKISEEVEYNENEEFNEYFDNVEGVVTIGDLEYSASELLYNTDKNAYSTAVQEYNANKELKDNDAENNRIKS